MIDKITDPNTALNAYSKSQNIARAATGADETGDTESGDGAGGISFAGFLKQSATESIDTMRASETMSARAVTGEADIVDVVQAVNAAELTLQTVVSVRDRMVTAYQEIMRMPI